MGSVELKDQLRGLDAVLTRDFVDPDRVGIYGHSYGGYMTILAMLRAADLAGIGAGAARVHRDDAELVAQPLDDGLKHHREVLA